MLKSCFQVIHVTIITPFSYFHLEFELECTQMYLFVHYTPWKCFKGFFEPAVNARRGDKNPHSSVVAETMKLLANSSYEYQKMDMSRRTLTKNLIAEKAHKAINNKFFKRLNYLNDNLYELESVKRRVKHNVPINVGFFVLQYAKLRKLELYYISSINFVTSVRSRTWKWTLILST